MATSISDSEIARAYEELGSYTAVSKKYRISIDRVRSCCNRNRRKQEQQQEWENCKHLNPTQYPLDRLPPGSISTWLLGSLWRYGVKDLGQLAAFTEADFLQIKNLSKRSLTEARQLLAKFDLKFRGGPILHTSPRPRQKPLQFLFAAYWQTSDNPELHESKAAYEQYGAKISNFNGRDQWTIEFSTFDELLAWLDKHKPNTVNNIKTPVQNPGYATVTIKIDPTAPLPIFNPFHDCDT